MINKVVTDVDDNVILAIVYEKTKIGPAGSMTTTTTTTTTTMMMMITLYESVETDKSGPVSRVRGRSTVKSSRL